MELIIEILGEFVIELFVSAAVEFFPDTQLKKWQKNLLMILAVFVALAILAALVAGFILAFDKTRSPFLGVCLICGGVLLLALQVGLYVYLNKKERRRKQKLQDELIAEVYRDGENRREC